MKENATQERIGITSTIPVEIIYAANCVPVDLNNVLVSNPNAPDLLQMAERQGLPRNCCSWVKGIYSLILQGGIRKVIGVVQGDCAPMFTMLESLLPKGVEFIPFSFPYEKSRRILRWEMQKLMDYLKVQWDDVDATKKRLDQVRILAHSIDQATWQTGTITSDDNFKALLNCTDFKGDPDGFGRELEQVLSRRRAPYPAKSIRLGILGVPGVFTDLHAYLEEREVPVVFHEIARQFAMPEYQRDLLDQNLCYTYPYGFSERLQDIREQTELRRLDGYIHYVQSFCHHQLDDLSLRRNLALPILTLEGDRIGPLDSRTKTRLEAFIQMLQQKKRRNG